MPRFFITIILLFGTLVLGFFYLSAEWNTFKTIRKETEGLRNMSAEFDELTQNRDLLVNLVNKVSKDDLQRIERALPQGQKSADVLVFLEAAALRHGLFLQHVDLAGNTESKSENQGQPKPGGGVTIASAQGSVREFPIALELVGSYESFKGLLKEIEFTLPLMDTQGISFSAPGRGGATNFTLRAKTYYQQ